jgi:hypothetical protein
MSAKEQLAIAIVALVIADAKALRKATAEDKEPKKKDPRAEALVKFFADNPKAFDCQRSNVAGLVTAITGVKIDLNVSTDTPPRLSVVVPINVAGGHGFELGKPVLVAASSGYAYSPGAPKRLGIVYNAVARAATDEEFAAFIEQLEKSPVTFYNYVLQNLGIDNAFPNGN